MNVKGGWRIFEPHHSFANVHLFRKTLKALISRGGVTPPATQIPIYSNSAIIALLTAKTRLDSILRVNEVIYTTPSYPSVSASFSNHEVSSGSVPVTSPLPPTYEIAGNINDFFGNLCSAFDIFAHVVNLVYLGSPLNESEVTFYKITDRIANVTQFQNETITQYVLSLRGSQWFQDLVPFRHCKTHRKTIPFLIVVEPLSPLQTSPWPAVKTILLPDDPYANAPTYQEKREMGVFGVNILKNSLKGIDDMFGLIEAKIRNTGHIPL